MHFLTHCIVIGLKSVSQTSFHKPVLLQYLSLKGGPAFRHATVHPN